MGEDLKVCQRHLDNVSRVNKSLEAETEGLKDTNLKAISKLQEPLANRTNTTYYAPTGKWATSSRATDFETGEFERKSCR